ncbi:hypothetical protein CAL29_24345 [Bordetella genomosp. 10]|uniref:LacI family transcriptional regulator n=1 Tax=Bordetella genomosp. 10 TaxID=1416804 RepID=A0A261S5J7_9BORD|nr:hypothetical protein CAL29_24345 [Bordetella genomosp. 10]
MALAVPLAAAALPARAGWPDKPVTLVVPFPPGGSNDIVARIISRDLAKALGQPIIIDNRGGAGGDLGAAYVARQKPDGYTLLITSSTFASNAAIRHNLPFDPIKSFAPIGSLAHSPLIVAVNNEFPASSPQELIARIREHPGKYNYASSGIGSLNQFSAELLKVRGGDLQIAHVPYKGVGSLVSDLIGDRVQVYIASAPVVLPMVNDGKIKGIGITSLAPSPVAPGLPTIASALPGYEYETWWGVLAPAGTPAPIVERVNAALNEVVADPEIKTQLLKQGAEPMGGTPARFAALIASEIKRLRELAAQQHIVEQ